MSPENTDAPSEGVVVERLRTEATNWSNGVALQAGRIVRRAHKPYGDIQVLEIDLHFYVVALARLQRCVERVSKQVTGLKIPLDDRLTAFARQVPWLRRIRNVSEHIDEYNIDAGHDRTVRRYWVQTWYLDKSESGGPVWGWLGERIDIEQSEQAALELYRGFLTDIAAWITARTDAS